MFPGFPTRIENDMNRMYKETILKGKDAGENAKVQIKIIVSVVWVSEFKFERKGPREKEIQRFYWRVRLCPCYGC